MRSSLFVLVLLGASACKSGPSTVADPTPSCKATLTAEQRRAFDEGLASVTTKDDHMVVSRMDAEISFYGPDGNGCMALASQCAVADAFAAEGQKAIASPSVAVRRILQDFRTRPQPGVLYAKPDWYAKKLDDMTDDQFSSYVAHRMNRCMGASFYGFVVLRSPNRANVETTNHLFLHMGPVLEELRHAASSSSSTPREELLLPILKRVVKGEISGATMWEHTPTQVERDDLSRCVELGPFVPAKVP